MGSKRSSTPKSTITNRRARHDYELGESMVVGVSLTGPETKALRMGHGHLRGAYVTVKDNELWLLNATITGIQGVKLSEEEQVRSRRLLAKRKEIDALIAAKQQRNSIIALDILNRGRYIKIRIAVGRGRKKYDKRQVIKKRDQDRENQRLTNQR